MSNAAMVTRTQRPVREPGCDSVQVTRSAREASGARSNEIGALLAGQASGFRRIMVATDFSAASMKAVELAAGLVEGCGAALTVLHVIDVNVGPGWGPAGQVMRELWETARVEMARLASWLDGRVEARGEVEEGLPAEVIVEKSKGYDLLVLAKKPVRSRWNLFARHTAERVAKCAACPVIVVEAGMLTGGSARPKG